MTFRGVRSKDGLGQNSLTFSNSILSCFCPILNIGASQRVPDSIDCAGTHDFSETRTEPVESIVHSINLSRILTYKLKKGYERAAGNLHPGPKINREISGLLYDMDANLYV